MYLRNFRICLWHSLRSGVLSSLKQMGWHFLYLFLSFEQKLIHLPSVYLLTDWLTHLSARRSYKLDEGGKILIWSKFSRFQAASHLANAPRNIWRIFGDNNNEFKTINLFTSISVRTWWESPTRWEKQDSHKISSRGLTRAVLVWFYLSPWGVSINPFLAT